LWIFNTLKELPHTLRSYNPCWRLAVSTAEKQYTLDFFGTLDFLFKISLNNSVEVY